MKSIKDRWFEIVELEAIQLNKENKVSSRDSIQKHLNIINKEYFNNKLDICFEWDKTMPMIYYFTINGGKIDFLSQGWDYLQDL